MEDKTNLDSPVLDNSPSAIYYFTFHGFDRKKTLRWRIFYFIFFYIMLINVFIKASLYTMTHSNIWQILGHSMSQLTTISLVLVNIYLFFGIIHSTKYRPIGDNLSKFFRVLQILAPAAQLTVFVFYWSVIAPVNLKSYNNWCGFLPYCYFHNIAIHGLGLIPTWIPLFTEPTLIKFKDVKYPMLYLVAYIGILAPVTVIGGEQIYPGITFVDVKTYILGVGAFFLMFGSFMLALKLSQNRHRKYFGGDTLPH